MCESKNGCGVHNYRQTHNSTGFTLIQVGVSFSQDIGWCLRSQDSSANSHCELKPFDSPIYNDAIVYEFELHVILKFYLSLSEIYCPGNKTVTAAGVERV